MLKTYRSLLTGVEEVRRDFERRNDERYSQSIEWLRAKEADLKARIAELERGQIAPTPRLPAVVDDPLDPDNRRNKLRPPSKPPVRD